MYNILLIVQILVAISIISLVLMQHGKGADAGAAFGGGGSAGGGASASGSVFGARGAGNFLSRTTAILAFAFFANSMALAWLVSNRGDDATSISVLDSVVPTQVVAPVETTPGDVPDAPDAASPVVGSAENDVPDAAPEAAPTNDVPEAESTEPATSDVPDAESAKE